ncbi:MAG: GTPase ObgE [Chloroflexi bacterium]|nr:GTPase ObgE [Chloroflexota bacterium]
MIDTVRLNIKGGDGGNGCVSFLREKFRPMGGPNGGDGGNGGNAYIVGDPSLNTLLHLKFNSTIYVERGKHGKGKEMRGGNGADDIIKVPLGTLVRQRNPDGTSKFIADITDETPCLIAQGGRGGWGNTRFTTSTNQEPLLSQKGEAGEYVVLLLELKLLADVGLLAKPNAGKSTLISRCSAAQPRIASYPFTTVEPVLGVVGTRNKSFVMMEVPGLIEGAHEGVGLGDQFLRHAERTRIYIHMLDGLSEDPIADYHMVNEELRQFNPALAEKPQIIAVNKVDVTEVRARQEELEKEVLAAVELGKPTPATLGKGPAPWETKPSPIFFISAATGEGIDALLGHVIELLDKTIAAESQIAAEAEAEPVGLEFRRSRRTTRPNTFHKDNGVYVIESEQLERLTAMADTRDYRVVLQIWREMTRLGLSRTLEEAGIEAGDTIRIGRAEMEWF